MPLNTIGLAELTAADIMTRDMVRLTTEMPLRDAMRLMMKAQVSGAPVVDHRGICVGVLSATDFLRVAERGVDVTKPSPPRLPITCRFQRKFPIRGGKEITLCTLPLGVCPIQARPSDPLGEDQIICSQPHDVLVDWQAVELERLPADSVGRYMTPDPVTAQSTTTLQKLARMMIDAHVHRVIVVDDEQKPIGIVSSIDLLATLAYALDKP